MRPCSAGQRHLLSEAGPFGTDRVLGDLADDELLGAQHLLDARLVLLLHDVLGVVLHVAAVQHGVLGRTDVDEGRLHAGQHVLHLAHVDVAVDLADVVGRPADVVLDQGAAFQHGDLRERGAYLHAHQIATHGAPIALAAAPTIEHVGVELGQWLHAASTRAAPGGTRSAALSATPPLLLRRVAVGVVAGACGLVAGARRCAPGLGLLGSHRRLRRGAGHLRCSGAPGLASGTGRTWLRSSRHRGSCTGGRWASVADLRPTDQRLVGRVDGRAILAHPVGQLRLLRCHHRQLAHARCRLRGLRAVDDEIAGSTIAGTIAGPVAGIVGGIVVIELVIGIVIGVALIAGRTGLFAVAAAARTAPTLARRRTYIGIVQILGPVLLRVVLLFAVLFVVLFVVLRCVVGRLTATERSAADILPRRGGRGV